MTAAFKRFFAAVEVLFTARVSKRLERFFVMGQRDAQYMLSGRLEPTGEMIEMLEEQVNRLQTIDLDAKIETLIADARAAGLHDEVIAAAVSEHYSEAFGRTVD